MFFYAQLYYVYYADDFSASLEHVFSGKNSHTVRKSEIEKQITFDVNKYLRKKHIEILIYS